MKIDRLQKIYFSIITVQHSCSAAIFLNNSSVRMRAPGKQVLQIQRQSWTQAGTADTARAYMKIDRLQKIYFSIITVQHSCSAAIFLNNSSVHMRAPGKQVEVAIMDPSRHHRQEQYGPRCKLQRLIEKGPL